MVTLLIEAGAQMKAIQKEVVMKALKFFLTHIVM